jgi:hypothetical protein
MAILPVVDLKNPENRPKRQEDEGGKRPIRQETKEAKGQRGKRPKMQEAKEARG